MPSFRLTCVTTAPCSLKRCAIDGEAVVLAGDLDAAGVEVLHRLVAAAMAELELVGLGADRPAQQLVAEADAENGHDFIAPWMGRIA